MKIKYLLPIALLGISPTVSSACPELTLTEMENFVRQGCGARININGVAYKIINSYGSTHDFVTHTNPNEIIRGMKDSGDNFIYHVSELRSDQNGHEVIGPEMHLGIHP